MEASKLKRKVVALIIEEKKELAQLESSTCVMDLPVMLKMPKSTVCTILKNKEAITAATVACDNVDLQEIESKIIWDGKTTDSVDKWKTIGWCYFQEDYLWESKAAA